MRQLTKTSYFCFNLKYNGKIRRYKTSNDYIRIFLKLKDRKRHSANHNFRKNILLNKNKSWTLSQMKFWNRIPQFPWKKSGNNKNLRLFYLFKICKILILQFPSMILRWLDSEITCRKHIVGKTAMTRCIFKLKMKAVNVMICIK